MVTQSVPPFSDVIQAVSLSTTSCQPLVDRPTGCYQVTRVQFIWVFSLDGFPVNPMAVEMMSIPIRQSSARTMFGSGSTSLPFFDVRVSI